MKSRFYIFFWRILFMSANLYGQGIPYNMEFQINTSTFMDQYYPVPTSLANGGFVVCWLESQLGHRINGQRFNSDGHKEGSEFIIVEYYSGYYTVDPSVTSLVTGDWVVCWSTDIDDPGIDFNVYGQLMTADGSRKNQKFQVNTYTENDQMYPAIAALPNSGFVVCWSSGGQDGSGNGIYAQLFDASGGKVGQEFLVNTHTQDWEQHPSIAALSDGGFVISWERMAADGSSSDIYGQLFSLTGVKKGHEFQVNTFAKYNQVLPYVASFPEGKFVVCWTSWAPDNSNPNIFGQMFSAAGEKIGKEFQINTWMENDQAVSKIAILSNGGFVVCWISNGQDGSGFGIFGQLYDSTGARKGQEFQLNSYTQLTQDSPSIAALTSGKFVVCWQSSGQDGSRVGVFGKIFQNEPIDHILQDFSLIEPKNDASLNTNGAMFRWRQPSTIRECFPFELTFDLYLDTDFNFSNPHIFRDVQDTSFTYYPLNRGTTYFWKVCAKNMKGDSLWSRQQNWGFYIDPNAVGVMHEPTSGESRPDDFDFVQNYPNPFNAVTDISSRVVRAGLVTIKIYDITGRLVKELPHEIQAAGLFSVRWDGSDVNGKSASSGIYLYVIEFTGNDGQTMRRCRKMTLLQ